MLTRLLKVDKSKFANARYYEDKYNLTRGVFIKIFNLYNVLSFQTIFKKLHSEYDEPLGDTPGMNYQRIQQITSTGVDYDTLENDSFPQLKIENSLMVHQLFSELKKSLDMKTSKISFF